MSINYKWRICLVPWFHFSFLQDPANCAAIQLDTGIPGSEVQVVVHVPNPAIDSWIIASDYSRCMQSPAAESIRLSFAILAALCGLRPTALAVSTFDLFY